MPDILFYLSAGKEGHKESDKETHGAEEDAVRHWKSVDRNAEKV